MHLPTQKEGNKILKLDWVNVCGCNRDEKRFEAGNIMRERNLDVLGLGDTKLKGKEKFGNFRGAKLGEGVAIIVLKNEL